MLKTAFSRTSPEALGIPSESVISLLTKLSKLSNGQDPHHFLLMRHGMVAAEGSWAPYENGTEHMLYSVSKTLTGTAVGFAVQEGLFGMDDKVCELLPEKLPEELQPEMRNLTVRMLLEMGAGQPAGDAHGGIKGEKRLQWQAKRAAEAGEDPAKLFFATPMIYEPGTVFGYNGKCSYLLGLLVTKFSGLDLMEYLRPRLFEPLGIPVPHCDRNTLGLCRGDSGVYLSAEELAAVGRFYLQKGLWNSKQLLNAEWVEEASKKHLPTLSQVGPDWSQGYCWQFWRGRHDSFRFCGAFGQMCVNMPDLDLNFVIQSGVDVDDMHTVLDAFYETVYASVQKEPLPENPQKLAELRELCTNLRLYPENAPSAEIPCGTWIAEAPCCAQSLTLESSGGKIGYTLSLRGGTEISGFAGTKEPVCGEIGLKNSAGADSRWSAFIRNTDGELKLTLWELAGSGRIDVSLRNSNGSREMSCALRRMRGNTDEAFYPVCEKA